MKYIILDFDGTIGDSQGLIVKTFQDTMREMGREVLPAEACAATIGMRLSEAFAHLYHSSVSDGEACAQVYHRIFEANRQHLGMRPFPHVVSTIRELYSRGRALAVASSRGRESLTGFIRQMGLDDCITAVVAQEDVVNVKPAPDMVFRALTELAGRSVTKDACHRLADDLRPMLADTVVVGDMTFDIDMAHNAGARACAVTYGNGTRQQLAGAEWVIDDFAQLALLPATDAKWQGKDDAESDFLH